MEKEQINPIILSRSEFCHCRRGEFTCQDVDFYKRERFNPNPLHYADFRVTYNGTRYRFICPPCHSPSYLGFWKAVHMAAKHFGVSIIEYRDAISLISEQLKIADRLDVSLMVEGMVESGKLNVFHRRKPRVYLLSDEITGYINSTIEERERKRIEAANDRRGYIYLLDSGVGLFKIGRAKNPKDRFCAIKTMSPVKISKIYSKQVSDYMLVESSLHSMMHSKREHGEWFRLEPEDIEKVKWYCENHGGAI